MIGRAVFSRSPVPFGLVFACAALCACPASAPRTGPEVIHAAPHTSHDPEVSALTHRAQQAFEAGRPADALAAVDEALEHHPFELRAGLIKVESHLALGENSAALSFAERLANARPDSAEAHYARGKALHALRRSSLALEAFERALQLAPDDAPSKLGLLAEMAHVQRFDLGHLETLADELVRAQPDLELAAVHQLAIAHEQRGELTKARTLYERAAQSGDPLVHYNLARLLHDTVGLMAARPHYERFLAHDRPAWRRERAEVKALTQRE